MSEFSFQGYPDILREYASYKLTIQGCSKKTVDEYMLDLRTFCRFLVASKENIKPTPDNMEKIKIDSIDVKTFEKVSTMDIYDFLAYIADSRENKTSARSRKLSAIKGLYKYLTVKRHYFESNPAINIEAPKAKRSLPKYLSMEESIDLLDAVKNDMESKTRLRDYAILTLFLNCGMRLSELCGIGLGDIENDLKSLRVIGKGSKERVVYLNDACKQAIYTYIPERQQVAARTGKNSNALFLSGRGDRISIKTVQWMVYKYLAAAGLEYKHFSTHKLRHTAATLMYQTGEVDIRVLKDILGHEQLTTTQIYTHVSNRNMEDAMQKNPLASIKPAKANESKKIEKKEEGND